MTEEEKPWVYPAKSLEEIETLAWDIHGGRVFGSWNCEPDMIKSCFMVLVFMERKQLDALKDQNITHVYEYLDQAGPRSVNGYPCFFSCHYINQEDMKKVTDRIKDIETFQKMTGPKNIPR